MLVQQPWVVSLWELLAPSLLFFPLFSHLSVCSSPQTVSCNPRVPVGWQLHLLLCHLGKCPPALFLMEEGLLIHIPHRYLHLKAKVQRCKWTVLVLDK